MDICQSVALIMCQEGVKRGKANVIYSNENTVVLCCHPAADRRTATRAYSFSDYLYTQCLYGLIVNGSIH